MVRIPDLGVQNSKPRGGSKVDAAFHLSEADQMSTRISCGLIG